MCGRASLSAPPAVLAELFDLDEIPEITPRWNVAPGQPIAMVRSVQGVPGRHVELARWGIAAREASAAEKPAAKRAPVILVRSESVFVRPQFREAATRRRCLVLVDGFYEWRGDRKHREPFHFRRRDGAPFALAAIWEPAPGDALECALLTTAAEAPVVEIHDRMPIALAARDHAAWLDPSNVAQDAARALMVFDPSADLVASAVGTFVNDASHEGPQCLEAPLQSALF